MNKQTEQPVKEITVQQLKSFFDTKTNFQLIDVREPYEHAVAHIGGILIPVDTIYFHLSEIAKNKQVVIYCRSGRRSANAVKLLQETTGQKNLFNLKGGILAWLAEIDKNASVKPSLI